MKKMMFILSIVLFSCSTTSNKQKEVEKQAETDKQAETEKQITLKEIEYDDEMLLWRKVSDEFLRKAETMGDAFYERNKQLYQQSLDSAKFYMNKSVQLVRQWELTQEYNKQRSYRDSIQKPNKSIN
jgi:hypothetical protein